LQVTFHHVSAAVSTNGCWINIQQPFVASLLLLIILLIKVTHWRQQGLRNKIKQSK